MSLRGLCRQQVPDRRLTGKITMQLKLISMLLFLGCMQVSARGDGQQITMHVKNASLQEVFGIIRQQTGYYFVYDLAMIERAKKVHMDVNHAPLPVVLDLCFQDQPLTYTIIDNTIIVKPKPSAPAQSSLPSIEIEGTVSDSISGRSLAGATVQIQGRSEGTTTSSDGHFTLVVPEGADLLVSYLGYDSKRVSPGGQQRLRILLTPSASGLNQVVVIGYGSQKKSEITGAISSIDGSDISSLATSDVQAALQGRVAGVNISPSTGQPGSPLDMNIRGVSTFGNSNPLFVVDGVPIMGDASSRIFNPISFLNPNDIKSIQILKDASAAAIYGARAANGVVIITTNRGAEGKNSVRFQSSVGVSSVVDHIDMMNSSQYAAYATEAFGNAGRPIPISLQEPLLSKNLKTNTDWQRELFSSGVVQNYWLGISGGNTLANYAFSGGYVDQEGVLPNSDFKKYSVRINSDFKLGKMWKVGESIELNRSIWSGAFDPTSPMMNQLLMSSPTVPVHKADANGGFDGPRLEYSPVGRANSIGLLSLTENTRTINKLVGNAYVEFNPITGLTNRTNLGSEITLGKTKNFTPTYDMGDYVNSLASLNEGRNSENIFLIENITTYHHIFNEVHDFTFLVGFTQQQSWATLLNVSLRNFQSNDLRTVAAGFEKRDIGGDETGWALRSQMARLNYSYKGKYNLMGVVRRDGSSRFGINNRYGVFPSISASWMVSEEPFMHQFFKLSDLKLRASYGKVGSQDIQNFAQYATVESGVDYVLGSVQTLTSGATFLNMGNPNLKWEVTTQTDIGVDIGFFDQSLSFVIDYYVKNTDGVLLQLPIATTSGIRRDHGPFVNAGALQNKGFEFTATYQDRAPGDFRYSISANLSTNKNKVVSLGSGEDIIARWSRGKQYGTTITQEGSEIGAFYGYVMEGVFKDQADVDKHAEQPGSAPGDVKFKDINGDHRIDASDQIVIGNPFPDFTYGLNVDLAYRWFDFSLFIQGKQGQDIYNLLWPSINDGEGDNNATREMLKRWTPDNTFTNIPRAITGNPGQNTRPSTRFVEDGSYMRVQNVQIGYHIGPRLINALKISNLRVYLSAKNLFTFTKYRGYNPEIGTLFEGSRSSLIRNMDNASYPIPRTIEGGIQVDF
jgi:TonB-linked SusC/RagA family outer membrane protein